MSNITGKYLTVPAVAGAADDGGGVADMGGQRGDHMLGIAVHATQGVGGERPLEFQPEVDKAGVGGGDAADLPWHVVVQGAERAQVGEAGAVAGGEQDGVGLLACSIGPGDAAGVKASEHGTADHAPGVQGAGVFAGVKNGAAAEVAGQPFGREKV